jgi:hypothetical protein
MNKTFDLLVGVALVVFAAMWAWDWAQQKAHPPITAAEAVETKHASVAFDACYARLKDMLMPVGYGTYDIASHDVLPRKTVDGYVSPPLNRSGI